MNNRSERNRALEQGHGRRPGYGLACLAVLLTALLCSSSGNAVTNPDRTPTEYEVKVAYVYYFAKFVNWPENAFASRNAPVIIGVFGNEEFGSLLSAVVKDKTIQERPISVRILKSAPDLQGCHIIYVSSSELKRTRPILDSIREQSALTITEADTAYKSKGIVNLFVEGGKVQFEVDIPAAERAHLQISSKLLRLTRGSNVATAREQ